jgi:hypothetical protein
MVPSDPGFEAEEDAGEDLATLDGTPHWETVPARLLARQERLDADPVFIDDR